jgi:hypothetical protein
MHVAISYLAVFPRCLTCVTRCLFASIRSPCGKVGLLGRAVSCSTSTSALPIAWIFRIPDWRHIPFATGVRRSAGIRTRSWEWQRGRRSRNWRRWRGSRYNYFRRGHRTQPQPSIRINECFRRRTRIRIHTGPIDEAEWIRLGVAAEARIVMITYGIFRTIR